MTTDEILQIVFKAINDQAGPDAVDTADDLEPEMMEILRTAAAAIKVELDAADEAFGAEMIQRNEDVEIAIGNAATYRSALERIRDGTVRRVPVNWPDSREQQFELSGDEVNQIAATALRKVAAR